MEVHADVPDAACYGHSTLLANGSFGSKAAIGVLPNSLSYSGSSVPKGPDEDSLSPLAAGFLPKVTKWKKWRKWREPRFFHFRSDLAEKASGPPTLRLQLHSL
jgi:hypothetical protein